MEGTTMTDTRSDLIREGWKLHLNRSLPNVIAGIKSAEVAAAAGVTTGSFYHHFPNSTVFADELVLSLLDQEDMFETFLENVRSTVDGGNTDSFKTIRQLVQATWDRMWADEDYVDGFSQVISLWAYRNAPLSEPRGQFETVGDVIGHVMGVREQGALEVWRSLLRNGRLDFAAPFNVNTAALILTSLFHGFTLRAAIDSDAVSDDLMANVAQSFSIAITTPRFDDNAPQPEGYRPGTIADAPSDSPLSPQAKSGAKRRRETIDRIVEVSIGMFDDGWESVSASDVAERADVSVQTVINLFGSVRKLAAMTFVRHTDRIRLAVQNAPDDPASVLHSGLSVLAECAASDPGAARALLDERLQVYLQPLHHPNTLDIRMEVPVTATIIAPVYGLGYSGLAAIDAAATAVQFVLGYSLGRANKASGAADLAMRLITPVPTSDEQLPKNTELI